MKEIQNKSLILIPDYLSIGGIKDQPMDALILGDPAKVPGELRHDRFMDVTDPNVRKAVMQMLPQVGRAAVMTPSMAFYRRVYELSDSCYFADIVSRLIASGAYVSVTCGMERERIPRRAVEWIKAMAEDGVKIIYKDAPEKTPDALDLITAAEVAACRRRGQKELLAAPGAIITPNARDEAKEKGVIILTSKGGSL